MPKLTDRERLADLEARAKKFTDEIEVARRALRGKYGAMVMDLAVESLSERDFKEIVAQAVRAGGGPALAALKPLPARSS